MWIFFVVLLCLAVAATVLTEVERFGWATFLLIVGVGIAQLFHVADLFGWVKTHGVETVIYTLVYVGVGVVWSFVKWFSFLMAFRDKFRQYKASFLSGLTPPLNPEGQVPENMLEDFRNYLNRQEQYSRRGAFADNLLSARPRAVNNKARIVSWMSLWPCSFIGTVLNDPVRRLFNLLFSWFKGLYQKMSDAIFAKDVELK